VANATDVCFELDVERDAIFAQVVFAEGTPSLWSKEEQKLFETNQTIFLVEVLARCQDFYTCIFFFNFGLNRTEKSNYR